MRDTRARRLLIVLLLALPVVLLLSSGSGVVDISWRDNLQFLAYQLGVPVTAPDAQQQLILSAIRWPRTLLAALVGSCLALSGAAMQGLFRNPLADPSLIGVSSGAAVGAALAIVFGATFFSGWTAAVSHVFGQSAQLLGAGLVSVFAFVGSFMTTVLVYRLGKSPLTQRTSVATMLLAGIAINALAAALTHSFTFIADDLALRRITLWQMGSLDGANWQRVGIAGLFISVVLLALPRYSKALNTLLLGESEARHLGVAVERIKWQLIGWTALGVGVSVSVAGIIGFVGLVVPHIVRLLLGPDHRSLLPASALLGAILLMLADTLARSVMAPAEIPIGIVTAILGAPFFIALLLQQRQRLLLQ